MNRLDEYLKLPYTLVLIPDLEEGGFTAYFPELKGCVTCGETYTEAVENAMDAKLPAIPLPRYKSRYLKCPSARSTISPKK